MPPTSSSLYHGLLPQQQQHEQNTTSKCPACCFLKKGKRSLMCDHTKQLKEKGYHFILDYPQMMIFLEEFRKGMDLLPIEDRFRLVGYLRQEFMIFVERFLENQPQERKTGYVRSDFLIDVGLFYADCLDYVNSKLQYRASVNPHGLGVMLNPPSFTSRAHHHVTQGVMTHSNPTVTQALGMWQQPPLHDERENDVGTSFNNPILLLEESVEELQYQELFQQASNVRRYNAVGTLNNPIVIDDELTLPTKK